MKTLKLTDIITALALVRSSDGVNVPVYSRGRKVKANLVDLKNYKYEPKLRMTFKVARSDPQQDSSWDPVSKTEYISVVLHLERKTRAPHRKMISDKVRIF